MIRSSIAVCVAGWAFFGASCQTLKPSNTYVFPVNQSGLFVIVNHGRNAHSNLEAEARRDFVFPESRILVADIPDFAITPGDAFFISLEGKRRSFNPNCEHPDSMKVCGYRASRNSGYNEGKYRQKFGLPPASQPVDGLKSFDFYFFSVAKDCVSDTADPDLFLVEIYRYLEEGDYKSTLPED